MKSKRLYYVIMPFIMAFTLLISLFAPLVPTDLSSAAVISGVTGLSASDAVVTAPDGTNVTDKNGEDLNSDWSYKVTYNKWTIPDNVNIQKGDTIQFEIPSNVQVLGDALTVPVKNSNNQEIGTATIEAGQHTGTITITNPTSLDNKTDRIGTLKIEGFKGYKENHSDKVINKTGWTNTDSNGKKYVTWQILYNAKAEKLSNVQITDTLGPNQKYRANSLKVWTGKATAEFTHEKDITSEVKVDIDADKGVIKIDLGNISTAISIEYETDPTGDNATALTNYAVDQNGEWDSANVGLGGSGTISGENQVVLKKESTKDSSLLLPGAIFRIKNTDTNETVKGYEAKTTDENGELVVKGLPDGNYAFIETDAPKGYELDSTPINFTLKDGKLNGKTNPIVAKNKPEDKSETIDITINKNWRNDTAKLRPNSIDVQLYKVINDKDIAVDGKKATLSIKNDWKTNFTNLPKKDSDGNTIAYKVKEINVPEGYTSSGGTVTDGKAIITNTYKPGKTQLNVSKVWNDTNNQDKLRPGKITVQLYKTVGKTTTEVDGKTAELTSENKWTADFTDLDATDSDGNPITYTAKEVSVPTGYSEKYKYSNDGKSETITNTHPAEETTSLTVNKVWNDKNASHPSVQVQLYKVDGDKKTAVGDPVTLSDEAGWSHTFDKLAKNATYTVKEVNSPSGYISEVSKAVNGKVTITNTPEAKTQVTVNKVWNDSNNKNGKRPTSIQVQLYANDEESGNPVTIESNKNGDWTYTWKDLPQNDSKGNKITYSVKEVDVPEGYAASYKTDGNVTTITNTYPAPETTNLKVNKVWKNGDPNLRPNGVQVQLYANGEKSGEPVTLSLGNNWSYNFKDLIKNDDNGQPIKYTVEEVTKVLNYTATQTATTDNAVTITNTYTPNKTQLTVNKVWNGDNKTNLRPSSIKVQLYANDQKIGDPVTIKPDKDGKWSYTFDKLDETDANGKKITYTAKEVGVPEGYGAAYEYSKDGKTETIINTHPAPRTKKLTVDKIWSDNRSNHSAVKVQLYKVDGKNKTAVNEPVTLSSKDGWSYTFTGLAKDSNYTVEEVAVPDGYTSQVSSVTNGKITITNTLKKTSLTVNKVWNDSKNKTGKRPTSIQVQLYANDKKSGDPVTIKPNKDGDWTYTFQNLDEVDENGKTISYKAEEVNVPEGYVSTSKTDGNVTTITNTYPAPETTKFKVTKDWKDNNNEYGLRPNEVTVQLLANGKAYGEPIVLNQGNNWTYEFTNLPKADTTYSVEEITNLANYNSSVDTSQSDQATIVNTVIPPYIPPVKSTSEKTQLTVNKVWNDNNNQDGKRPSEVTVNLLANGKETGKSVELSDKNNWAATFSDLDKTDSNGNPISYTVEEVKVDGYKSEIGEVKNEQVTITNTRDTTVPPTKPTTPDQPITPPVKSTTPGQPIVPPVKSTTTTATTEKNNKPKTFTDKVKQVVSGLLPQTGANKTNAILTYVGLLLIVIVFISWAMIARKRKR